MPKDENWIASQNLTVPLKWRKSRHVVVVEDLFHENVPDEWIDRVFAIMALTPQHTYQVLTKRADRMREYVTRMFVEIDQWDRIDMAALKLGATADEAIAAGNQFDKPLPNVWLGVSAEDQPRADQRIPDLLATPAAVRFVSVEPMLGPVDLERWLSIHWQCSYCRGYFGREYTKRCPDCGKYHGMTGSHRFNGRNRRSDTIFPRQSGQGIDWVICGGESGGSARPMHPDWARSLRDQCAAAGVPFFFKQWGEWELSLDRDKNDPDWQQDYSRNYKDEGRSRWLNIEGGRGFHGDRFCVMRRVGKNAAGRLLDGVQHDGRPETKGET